MCQHYKWCCSACEYLNTRTFRCPRAQILNRVCAAGFEPSDLPPRVRPQLCDGCGTATCATPADQRATYPEASQPPAERTRTFIKTEPGSSPAIGLGIAWCSPSRPDRLKELPQRLLPDGRPTSFRPSAPTSASQPRAAPDPRPCLKPEPSSLQDVFQRLPDNAAILARYRRERADADRKSVV